MLTIYFTIPHDHHQLTMPEVLKSDSLNAGMLEAVYSTDAGVTYSWHDLRDGDITKVLVYIAENIGKYQTTIEAEETEVIIQKDTPTTITLDTDTHMVEILHAPASMLPDYFDQCHIVEIINEDTGELLYAETEDPADCDYISHALTNFFRKIGEN